MEDDINADEEINEVLEDDNEEMDKSVSAAEDETQAPAAAATVGATETAAANDVEQDQQEEDQADKSIEEVEPEDGEDTSDKDAVKDTTKKKSLSMQLSSQTLQKLLKEGKMERLPTGSFRISSDALKKLKKETGSEVANSSVKQKIQKRTLNEMDESISDNSDEEQEKPPAIKKSKLSAVSKYATTKDDDIKSDSAPASPKTPVKDEDKESLNAQAALDQPKNKANVAHNYVSDFNSSEDEDEEVVFELMDSLAELAPRKSGHTSKPVSLLFEHLHKSMFGNISDDSLDELEDEDKDKEERIRQLALSDPDFGKSSSTSSVDQIPTDFYMVGRIGNGCKTKMCIRSTPKQKTFEGRQYPVYNIDTGIGSVTTVTPLMVTALNTEAVESGKVSIYVNFSCLLHIAISKGITYPTFNCMIFMSANNVFILFIFTFVLH